MTYIAVIHEIQYSNSLLASHIKLRPFVKLQIFCWRHMTQGELRSVFLFIT